MGARAIYLFANGKDTLFRIHGTNQPEYIGSAISSGCIRLTNEDVIDLYNRVKLGSPVVVLAPGRAIRPTTRGSRFPRAEAPARTSISDSAGRSQFGSSAVRRTSG